MRPPKVRVHDLRKHYAGVEAARGVSFEVEDGEIFGLIGPNGAGKTTTVECLIGLREPDSGTIEICGIDARPGLDLNPGRRALNEFHLLGSRLLTCPDSLRAQPVPLVITGDVHDFMSLDYLHDLAGETMRADGVTSQEDLVDVPGQLRHRAFQAINVAVHIRDQAYSQFNTLMS